MELQEIKKKIESAVAEYLECDQAWGDAPMLVIDPAKDFAMEIVNEEEADVANPSIDCIWVMELLHMSTENPGTWEPDPEAIASLAESYLND